VISLPSGTQKEGVSVGSFLSFQPKGTLLLTVDPLRLPPAIYNTEGGCQPVKVTKEFAWKFIYTVIFDFFILLTTTVGVIRIRGTSRLGSLLFSQGIFYFSLVSAVNLVTLVVVLLQLSPLMSIAGAVPSAGISG